MFHHHIERLLIILYQLGLRGVGNTRDTRRQHIVDGFFVVILFDIDSTHLHDTTLRGRSIQTLLIDTPLASHQIETTKAQYDRLLETRHEHTHETDTGKVVDRTHLALIFYERDAELIPIDTGGITITQLHTTGTHISDITTRRSHTVTISIQYFGRDTHTILVITFVLVEGVIHIDILHIRTTLIAGVVTLCLLIGIRRVSLRIVDALVTIEDTLLLFIKIAATVVVIVIACRVVVPSLTNAIVRDRIGHAFEPLMISPILLFFLIVQTIEAHILQFARAGSGGKGISLSGLHGNLTPLGGSVRVATIYRHTALVEFHAITQDILAHFTQIEIQITTIL